MDSFIDIVIWFTIIILTFNVFAIWVNSTTTVPFLHVAGFNEDVNGLRVFDENSDMSIDTNATNTIGDSSSEVSTQRQANIIGYEGNIFGLIGNLLLMWHAVLYSVIPAPAIIIAQMISVIVGIIETVGLLGLLMKLAQAIGALLPF